MRFRAWVVVVAVGCLVALAAVVGEPGGRDFDDCSAVVLINRGQAIYGGNYDMLGDDDGMLYIHKRGVVKTGTSASKTGVVARWTSRYASVAFSLVGLQHAWAGMNERGLAFSTMRLEATGNQPPDERPSVDWMWPQYILDTCETVEDVIASDASVRNWTVDHFLFTDRTGGVAIIEFLDGEMVAHSGGELCTTALTNTTYSYACEIWESMRSGGDYSGLDNSLLRFCNIADRVSAFEGGTTAEAVDFAFETLSESYPPHLRRHTRWSIVFDTLNLRAYYRTFLEPEIRWVDLAAFDPRCGRPVMMLGINEVVSGDATRAFWEYDPERNLEFREAYYERWGIDYDPAQTRELMEYVESFPCVRMRRAGERKVVAGRERR